MNCESKFILLLIRSQLIVHLIFQVSFASDLVCCFTPEPFVPVNELAPGDILRHNNYRTFSQWYL